MWDLDHIRVPSSPDKIFSASPSRASSAQRATPMSRPASSIARVPSSLASAWSDDPALGVQRAGAGKKSRFITEVENKLKSMFGSDVGLDASGVLISICHASAHEKDADVSAAAEERVRSVPRPRSAHFSRHDALSRSDRASTIDVMQALRERDLDEASLRPKTAPRPFYKPEWSRWSHARLQAQETILSPALKNSLRKDTLSLHRPASNYSRRSGQSLTPASVQRPGSSTTTPFMRGTAGGAHTLAHDVGHFKRRFLGDTLEYGPVASRPASAIGSRPKTPQERAALMSHKSQQILSKGSQAIVGKICQSGEKPDHPFGATSLALDPDSAQFHNILIASKHRLVTSADPQGNFSWTVPVPETYSILPNKLLQMHDWTALSVIMCDLRFLHKKLLDNGVQSILRMYEEASMAMSSSGAMPERFGQYHAFFVHNIRLLEQDHTKLFPLALSSKLAAVRTDCCTILATITQLVESITATLAISGSSAEERSRGQATAEGTASLHEMQELVLHIDQIQHCRELSLPVCLSTSELAKLNNVSQQLAEKVQAYRTTMQEKGFDYFREQSERFLHLRSQWQKAHGGQQLAHLFMHLAQMWEDSGKEDYADLTVMLPSHAYEKRTGKVHESFEQALAHSIADAAGAPRQLVDFECFTVVQDQGDNPGAHMAHVLVKFLGYVPGVHVTVIQGRDWPRADMASKSEPAVKLTLRDVTAPGLYNKSMRSMTSIGSGDRHTLPKKSLLARVSAATVHQTTSFEGDPGQPHFDEQFPVLIYDSEQDLVITACDSGLGNHTRACCNVLRLVLTLRSCHELINQHRPSCAGTVIGEARVKAKEILAACIQPDTPKRFRKDTVVYTLYRPGTTRCARSALHPVSVCPFAVLACKVLIE